MFVTRKHYEVVNLDTTTDFYWVSNTIVFNFDRLDNSGNIVWIFKDKEETHGAFDKILMGIKLGKSIVDI